MRVLLVIDPQMAYFDKAVLPVTNPKTIDRIVTLVEELDAIKVLVTHAALNTPVHPALNDLVFTDTVGKEYASAFTKTNLADMFTAPADDTEIIICGYQSHHCVVTTALEAAAYGKVFVVTDACSSPDILEVCQKWERNPATPRCGIIPGEIAHDVGLASACQFYCTPITTTEALSRFT